LARVASGLICSRKRGWNERALFSSPVGWTRDNHPRSQHKVGGKTSRFDTAGPKSAMEHAKGRRKKGKVPDNQQAMPWPRSQESVKVSGVGGRWFEQHRTSKEGADHLFNGLKYRWGWWGERGNEHSLRQKRVVQKSMRQ